MEEEVEEKVWKRRCKRRDAGGGGSDGGGWGLCGGGGGGGGVAEAQTFSSLLPSFMFIVGVAGSWCRLLVTEWAGMMSVLTAVYRVGWRCCN